MQLKRIVDADTASATETVIQTYGRDALIISNRRVNDQVELIVAIDGIASDGHPNPADEADLGEDRYVPAARPAASPGAAREAAPGAPSEAFATAVEQSWQRLRRRSPSPAGADATPDTPSAAEPALTATPGPPAAPAAPATAEAAAPAAPAAPPPPDSLPAALMARVDDRLERIEAQLATLGQATPPADPGALEARLLAITTQLDTLQQLVSSLREGFLPSATLNAVPANPTHPEALGPLVAHLPPRILPYLAGAEAMAPGDDPGQWLRQQLAQRLSVADASSDLNGIHVFAGPPGAGKSTTAQRLARTALARFGPASVLLIRVTPEPKLLLRKAAVGTQDTLPQIEVDVGSGLQDALDTHLLRRLLVIDLAGAADKASLQNLRNLFSRMGLEKRIKRHLVVAADANLASVVRYLGLTIAGGAWDDVVLTRLDCIDAPWEAIELLLTERLPLALAGNDPAPDKPFALSPLETLFERLPAVAKHKA